MASRSQYGDYGAENEFEVRFGVEIEMVLSPKIIPMQTASSSDEYWRITLATLLENEGLVAVARRNGQRYGKATEHYDKWFITTDGSIRSGPGES